MSILEMIKYVFLGLVQGITEVLPISSSGHVELVKNLIHLQVDEGLLFLVILNTGSLLTFLFVYRKKVLLIIVHFFKYIFKPQTRGESVYGFSIALKLVIASIPAVILGLILEDVFDSLLVQYNLLISGIGLLFTGTVLFLVSSKKIRNGSTRVGYVDAILIGLSQGIALFPGVSRSGMTTSTGISRGIGIESALDFSFLMYIPVSVGSLILTVSKLFDSGLQMVNNYYYLYYFFAFLMSISATYIAFKLIFNIFKAGKMKYFGYYCLIIGAISVTIFIAR